MTALWYAVIAPRWRRRTPYIGGRRLVRWSVIRESRGPNHGDNHMHLHVWGYKHVSAHWTKRGAERAANQLRKENPR